MVITSVDVVYMVSRFTTVNTIYNCLAFVVIPLENQFSYSGYPVWGKLFSPSITLPCQGQLPSGSPLNVELR